MNLVRSIYTLTAAFPLEERYGLSGQMRRAAVSVPSNIAEGAGRETPKEFIRYLYIARGSLAELETQLLIANDLNYTAESGPLQEKIDEVSAPLNGLINHLKRKEKRKE